VRVGRTAQQEPTPTTTRRIVFYNLGGRNPYLRQYGYFGTATTRSMPRGQT
jgi:hypothetical protein